MFICHLCVLFSEVSFAHFLIGLLVFILFYFTVELWTFFILQTFWLPSILARSLLLDIWFADIFLPVFNFFLFFKIFLIGSLGRKVFNFDEVQFIRFLFMGLVFGVKSENCRPSSVLWRFSVVLHLSLWSVWISFYVSYEIWVKVFFFLLFAAASFFLFFFLPINLQVLQHHWLKRPSFLHWITFAPFSKSSWPESCMTLILGLYFVPLIWVYSSAGTSRLGNCSSIVSL